MKTVEFRKIWEPVNEVRYFYEKVKNSYIKEIKKEIEKK